MNLHVRFRILGHYNLHFRFHSLHHHSLRDGWAPRIRVELGAIQYCPGLQIGRRPRLADLKFHTLGPNLQKICSLKSNLEMREQSIPRAKSEKMMIGRRVFI